MRPLQSPAASNASKSKPVKFNATSTATPPTKAPPTLTRSHRPPQPPATTAKPEPLACKAHWTTGERSAQGKFEQPRPPSIAPRPATPVITSKPADAAAGGASNVSIRKPSPQNPTAVLSE